MKLYYHAVTQDGKTIRGLIDARDIREAASYLRKHQLVPIKITPPEKVGLTRYFPFLRRSSKSDLIFFTRQLASMLTSGLTLMQALTIMKNQVVNPLISEIIQTVIADVENGKNFSTAIEKYPNVFSPIYIAFIRTAESSGLLDKILARLADNLEKDDQLQRTVKGALLYPVIIIIMMIGVMGVMMIFVIPQLSTLYGNLNMSLPLPTLVVITISNIVSRYWEIVLVVVGVIIFYLNRWYHKESGKRVVDTYSLKVPVFGKLLSQTMMSEFTRTLGLLVSSGSLVVDSLTKSAQVVDNLLYKDAIMLVAKRVEKGIAMGDAMAANPLFPSMVIEMVRIGEQTGKLDDALMRASEYYEREVEETVKTLTTLMEPIIMVMLAVGVGFLIIAVITPIYNLISSIN